MPTSKKALLDISYDEMGQDGNLIKRDASFEREYIMSEEGFARIQAMPLFDEVTAGTFSFDDTDAPQKNDQNKALKESPSTDKSLAAEALQQLMSSTSFIQNSPLKVANDSIIQDVVHDNQSVQRFQQSQASIGATSYMVSPSAPAPPPSFYTRGPGMIYVNAPQYVHQHYATVFDKNRSSYPSSCNSPRKRNSDVETESTGTNDVSNMKRGKYKCSYCGQIKANHVCSVVCTKNEGAQTEFTGIHGKVSTIGVKVIVVGERDTRAI